ASTSSQLLERGDVRLVVLRDVRDDVPRVAEVLRGLAADVADRLALDRAPLREVGHRLGRGDARGRTRPAARQRVTHVALHVFGADAAAGAAAVAGRSAR